MTREETKEWIPILQAYAEGKTIQVWHDDGTKYHRGSWRDTDCVTETGHRSSEYRIKPEPVCRPFKDGEELVAEYCRRFGVERKAWEIPQIWVKDKDDPADYYAKYLIIGIVYGAVFFASYNMPDKAEYMDFDKLLDTYAFLDGSPCGVEEATDASSN